MNKTTHKRLTAWLLTLALVVTLLPGMGMTALAAEDGGEGNGPPAVEVVEPGDGNSGSDKTVGTPPSTEPEPTTPPKSTEEDKTTEGEGDPSGSDYDIEADTQPRGLMRALAAPTAAGTYPAANVVFVDGGKNFYNPTRLYYKNGDSDASFTGTSTDFNAAYDPATGTLTLDGYNGKGITVGGVGRTDITVKLVGTNIINDGSLENAVGGDITITSDSSGTLSITRTLSGGNAAIGIETGLSASYTTGNVTIKGNAKVTIDMTHTGTSTYEKAYGIYAEENITISENASVDITCATPNNTTGGSNCNGMFANGNVSIDTTGKIKIDVTKAGKDDAYSFGIYPMGTPTLTRVGEMQVQWKKHASISRYSGGTISGSESFSDTDHAINVDTTNCYASYRFGTPRTVMVENGTVTGPGVPNAKDSGKFLENDTVNITPYERKGKSGETIPFKGWTSSDVTLTSPTTASNSFTVPGKDVTVTAMHNPFDGAPTFTPTGTTNTEGTLTFKTLVKPHDGNEYFRLVKDGEQNDESKYISFRPDNSPSTSPYEYSYETRSLPGVNQVDEGNYYVAEYLNGNYYLSEKFTVNYVKPRPEISVSYWPDPTVFTSVEVGYDFATGRTLTIDNKGTADTGPLTITVEGANPEAFTVSPSTISNIAAGKSAMSTVRPATGLPAGTYTATLKISGDNVNTLSLNVKFTVTPKITPIPRPTANTGLVYNGTEQIGVNESAGYTLTGTYKATDVGATSYTATATLNSNYKWSDGGTDPVTITWSIGKRDPKIEDFEITLPDERTEHEIKFGTDGPYATYDGTAKTATAKLKAKYSGCGDITVKYRKFVSTGTYATLDEAVDAGMYDVLVYVAAGGSNFNAASALVYNTSFLIKPVPLSMPQLTVKAPTAQGDMGKIVGTTTQMQYAPKGTTNWKPCSGGETSVMPGTYYLYLKADSTDTNHTDSSYAEVTVPEYGAGVTVSGRVKSYNPGNAITIQLKQGAEVKYTTTIAAESGSGQVTQDFSFSTVAAGTYDLVITKGGHLTYTVTGVVVGSSDLDLTTNSKEYISTMTLLAGDVNMDGKINESDVSVIRYSSNINKLISEAANKLTDVNGDGKVNESDVSVVRYSTHINKSEANCTYAYAE